jgi:hypothetical protein
LQALYELAFAIHAGITDEEFEEVARGWLATAKHPKVAKLFKEGVYGPQIELLTYLRENSFKTYIVSAGAPTSCPLSWTKLTVSHESR